MMIIFGFITINLIIFFQIKHYTNLDKLHLEMLAYILSLIIECFRLCGIFSTLLQHLWDLDFLLCFKLSHKPDNK